MTSWRERQNRDSGVNPGFSTEQDGGHEDNGVEIIIDKQMLVDKAVTASITGVASAIAVKTLLEDE